jgi:hypothetical protein
MFVSFAFELMSNQLLPEQKTLPTETRSTYTYCTTLHDATFQTGSTHAAKTAPPAPREMVWPLYHGHSYQQLTVYSHCLGNPPIGPIVSFYIYNLLNNCIRSSDCYLRTIGWLMLDLLKGCGSKWTYSMSRYSPDISLETTEKLPEYTVSRPRFEPSASHIKVRSVTA